MDKRDLELFDAETRKYLEDGSMIFNGDVEDLFDSDSSIEEDYDDDISGLDNTRYAVEEEKVEDDKFEPIPDIIV